MRAVLDLLPCFSNAKFRDTLEAASSHMGFFRGCCSRAVVGEWGANCSADPDAHLLGILRQVTSFLPVSALGAVNLPWPLPWVLCAPGQPGNSALGIRTPLSSPPSPVWGT